MTVNNRIAIFASTSGHSGVDRKIKNLVPSLIKRGYCIDILHVRKHGPYLEPRPGLRIIDTKTRYTYLAAFSIARYLRREQPAVLYCEKDRVNRTAMLARLLAGSRARLVISQGTTVSIDLQSRGWLQRQIQSFSMGRLYRYADQVITISSRVADDMSEFTGLPRHLIDHVHSPFLNADLFSHPQIKPDHPWFSENIPIVVGVGELSHRKDFATLVKAMALVTKTRPCRLILVGKGREFTNLKVLAQEIGIADKVDLPGYQSNPYGFMAYASVFVTASLWEGLSAVVCEALAVGTHVIASRCPGHSEVLQDGRYGDLFDFGDSEALAKLILHALEQPHAPEHLREAARPFEIEQAAGDYLKAFNLPATAFELENGPDIMPATI